MSTTDVIIYQKLARTKGAKDKIPRGYINAVPYQNEESKKLLREIAIKREHRKILEYLES